MKDSYESPPPAIPQDDEVLGPVANIAAAQRFTRPRRRFGEDEDGSYLTPYAARDIADPHAARWHELQLVPPGVRQHMLEGALIVDYYRESHVAKTFDLLRTRLRQTVKKHRWRNIAITAPTSSCGNTFTAINLAMSLSRVPSSRTVLMDLNMRDPGLADVFDMDGRGAIGSYLSGETPMNRHMMRVSDTLALGLNDTPDIRAAEILQDPATAQTLERMRLALHPDIVLYDMPPMLAYDDVSAFLPQLDGVLLVSDGTQTTARHLAECERMIEGQVPLLGVILNRARKDSIERFA